jgi:hypothetical protein
MPSLVLSANARPTGSNTIDQETALPPAGWAATPGQRMSQGYVGPGMPLRTRNGRPTEQDIYEAIHNHHQREIRPTQKQTGLVVEKCRCQSQGCAEK